MLVWMDLEMTGLNPETDVIIEIATIVTDDDLNVLKEGPDLIIKLPDGYDLENIDPYVKSMHESSGLLDAVLKSDIDLTTAGKLTLEYISEFVEQNTTPLAGNSIGMDRRFLAKYLPEIENYLSYRSVDVSALKELCKRWYPEIYRELPKKQSAHRSLSDILESIEELKYYRQKLFK
jgi:oligoribonuclease